VQETGEQKQGIDFFVALWGENVSENLETMEDEFWMLYFCAFQMSPGET
jgi:hypothetical protein